MKISPSFFRRLIFGGCGLAVGTMSFLKTDSRARQPSPPSPKQHIGLFRQALPCRFRAAPYNLQPGE